MSADPPPELRIPRDTLLDRLAGELVALRDTLHSVQDALADLAAHSPPEPDMVRRLQALDAATQTADNLARVLEDMARFHPHGPDADRILSRVDLKDLAHRLVAAPDGSEAGPSGHGCHARAGSAQGGDVSWF